MSVEIYACTTYFLFTTPPTTFFPSGRGPPRPLFPSFAFFRLALTVMSLARFSFLTWGRAILVGFSRFSGSLTPGSFFLHAFSFPSPTIPPVHGPPRRPFLEDLFLGVSFPFYPQA